MRAKDSGRHGSGPPGHFHDSASGSPDGPPGEQSGAVDETDGVAASREKPESPEQRARDMVYRLLATRARSRSELTQALLRKDIEERIAESTVQKFVDAGLVDDASFAESWVESRHRHQGLGRKALGIELRRKGVAADVVAEALSNVDEDSEVERARELVQRKLRGMPAADHTARMRRLVGMLARKGYSESLAFRVVREELERSGVDGSDGDDHIP